MKLNKLKKTVICLAVSLATVLNGVVLANSTEDAEALVATAESTALQSDIDTAQTAVADLAESAQRSSLEIRLDSLQSKVDATLKVDFEDETAGEVPLGIFTNTADAEYVQENGNQYLQLSLKDTNTGGWGNRYALADDEYFPDGDFYVEQKFKFEGTASQGISNEVKIFFANNSSGQKLIMDAGINEHNEIWSGSEMESWGFPFVDIPDLSGKWCAIRYTYTEATKSAVVTLTDLETGNVAAQSSEISYQNSINASSWNELQYQFGGATPDET